MSAAVENESAQPAVVPPAVEADPALRSFVSDLSAKAAQAAFLGLAEGVVRSPTKVWLILPSDLQSDFVLAGCDHVESVRQALESIALDEVTIDAAALFAGQKYQANIEELLLLSSMGGRA